jgi:copper chaperone CopZ
MKIIICIFTVFILFNLLNLSSTNSQNFNFITNMTLTETTVTQKIVKIKCNEMSCDACKRSITKSINQLQGIKSLNIDLESKKITVIYDDTATDELSILNAVVGAGYEAEIID